MELVRILGKVGDGYYPQDFSNKYGTVLLLSELRFFKVQWGAFTVKGSNLMLPELDNLDPLSEPFEMLELLDEQEIILKPKGFMLGKAMINPRDGRPAKLIRVLRVDLSRDDKPTLPQYWDVTSVNLIAGLMGHFTQRDYLRKTYTIKKHGEGPRARFTLDISPVVTT